VQSHVDQGPSMLPLDIALLSDHTQEDIVLETPPNHKLDITEPSTTSTLHAKRRIIKAPYVVTDVRRSIRPEGKQKGFKCDVGHLERDCFCCTVDPPSLSRKTIRSLGREFCKILENKMTEATLQKKPLAKKVVPIGRPSKKEDKSNEDKSSKKSRKA
jgi:hypothetical protein